MTKEINTMLNLKKLALIVAVASVIVAMPLAAETHTGGAVYKITVVTQTAASTTNVVGWKSLTGAFANITVPAGGPPQLVNVRFSAESYCTGGGGWCQVKIMDDATGMEMKPAANTNFAFDTPSSDLYEGNAMERTLVLDPGPHTIQVYFGSFSDAATFFTLDDWTLAVTQYKNGI